MQTKLTAGGNANGSKPLHFTFQNIQLLRALAAFAVFLFHAAPQYQAMGGAWDGFANIARYGFSGVDVFFVVSGFVAALTTLPKERGAGAAFDFLRRRFLRIYLGYWPFFALSLALLVIYRYVPLADIDWVGSFFLTATDMPRLLLYVSWSLSYELIFYMLAALSLVLPRRGVMVAVHMAAFGIVWALIAKWGRPLSGTLIFLSYLLEFLMGSVLFVHRKCLVNRWWVPVSALLGFFAYLMGVSLSATDGSARLFTFGLGAVSLVALMLTLEQARMWQAGRFFVGLGDASYALYLLHPSLLILFASGLGAAIAAQPPMMRELGFVLFLGAGVFIARIWYLRIEYPLYHWGLRRLSRRTGDRLAAQSMRS